MKRFFKKEDLRLCDTQRDAAMSSASPSQRLRCRNKIKNMKHTFKYLESEEALHIGGVSGITVFERGCLVRVYDTFFSKKMPNDVDKTSYRDILIDKLESPLSTHYCIIFRGVDVANPNPNTNRSDFSVSLKGDALRYIEKLENHQFKLAV